MTEAVFLKHRFKSYEMLDFKSRGMKESVPCMLLCVHFENMILTIVPIDQDYYERNEIYARLEDVNFPIK